MPRFALIGIRIAIVGAVIIGGLLFRDRLSGGASDLAVGDCFDMPNGLTEVEDVQHHPCNEAHTSEVVYVGDMPASDTYPSDSQFVSFVEAQCIPAFNGYTGLDYLTDQVIDMGYLTPTLEGWGGGDHELICYAIRVDGSTVSQSLKGAR